MRILRFFCRKLYCSGCLPLAKLFNIQSVNSSSDFVACMQMMTDAIGIETATEGVEGTGRDQGAERENGDVTEAEKGSDADTGPLHPQ